MCYYMRWVGYGQMIKGKWGQRYNWQSTRPKALRITILTQFFPPDFAATGQLIEELVSYLARRDLQFEVITGMPSYAFSNFKAPRIEFKKNICIRRTRVGSLIPRKLRARIANSLLYTIKMLASLTKSKRRGNLILVTSEPPFLPLIMPIVSRLFKCPYIVIIYDVYPEVLVRCNILPKDSWLYKLWKLCNRHAYKAAKEVIVLSSNMKEEILVNYPDLNSVKVIQTWVDTELFQKVAVEDNWFAKKENLEDKFVIMYSGNQGRCHDMMSLIKCAEALRHDMSILFMIIGDGAQHEEIKKYAMERKLKNIRFMRYQEKVDLKYTLSTANLAVVSQKEGFDNLIAPCKIYPHMSLGTPLLGITPSTSILREIIETNKIGVWVSNDDIEGLKRSIMTLKENKKIYTELAQNARAYVVENHNKDKVMESYYDSICRNMSLD